MFGLNLNIEGIGYMEKRYHRLDLHGVKSVAGKVFHRPDIISVCVFDEAGTARLYLKKTENGVVREEREALL
jgi:hypothetical protein